MKSVTRVEVVKRVVASVLKNQKMKLSLLASPLVLFQVIHSTKQEIRHKPFAIPAKYLAKLVNEALIPFKPDNQLSTKLSPSDLEDEESKYRENVLRNRNDEETKSTAYPTVEIRLPKGKTIDEYISFIVEDNLFEISEHLKENSYLKMGFVKSILIDELGFAAECLKNLKYQNVCPSVSKLDAMLRENFKIEQDVISRISDNGTETEISGSLFRDIFSRPERYKAYVYIPECILLDEFVQFFMSANTKNCKKGKNLGDEVWLAITKGLKDKKESRTRKVPLVHLLQSMSKIIHYKTSSQNINGNESKVVMKKIVRFPEELSDELLIETCDKIYLDFGLFPLHWVFLNSCDILKEVIVNLMEYFNGEGQVSGFSDLIFTLQHEITKSNYKQSFVAERKLKSIYVPIKELYEKIANKLNSIKLPLFITPNEIPEPPAESGFTKTYFDGDIDYQNDEFPNLFHELTGSELAFYYIRFIKEKLGPKKQNEQQVLKEFFDLFWATETVERFGGVLVRLNDFAREEKVIADEIRKKLELDEKYALLVKQQEEEAIAWKDQKKREKIEARSPEKRKEKKRSKSS